MNESLVIAGLDLAWGDRRPDGLCLLDVDGDTSRVRFIDLRRGDRDLLEVIDAQIGDAPSLLMVDAPLICPNPTGARPADRLSHVLFHREKCGCHPTNATRCPRPLRIAQALRERGYRIEQTLPENGCRVRVAVEVYPHPALVRWFELAERIPYKRGPVAARRVEFARLQALLRHWLPLRFPHLVLDAATLALLGQPWSKDVEDQTDSLVCALIGEWHWRYRGTRSQVVGDAITGFFIVPTLEPLNGNCEQLFQ